MACMGRFWEWHVWCGSENNDQVWGGSRNGESTELRTVAIENRNSEQGWRRRMASLGDISSGEQEWRTSMANVNGEQEWRPEMANSNGEQQWRTGMANRNSESGGTGEQEQRVWRDWRTGGTSGGGGGGGTAAMASLPDPWNRARVSVHGALQATPNSICDCVSGYGARQGRLQ